jgi:hypothetical protein
MDNPFSYLKIFTFFEKLQETYMIWCLLICYYQIDLKTPEEKLKGHFGKFLEIKI